MQKKPGQTIVIIGCGNVAWHLARRAMQVKGFKVQVHNHQASTRLKKFAKELGCACFSNLSSVPSNADYYFLCVPDRLIAEVAGSVNINSARSILFHTSGSTPISDLGLRGHGVAVFYPLQTFTFGTDLDWNELPVLVQADNAGTVGKARSLAQKFSSRVFVMKEQERLATHLAAVMVNNFTNSLAVAAGDLLRKHVTSIKDPERLMIPLMKETVEKLEHMSGREAQTGPARRRDKNIINKHLSFLSGKGEIKRIYRLMTKLIRSQQK